MNKEPKLIYKYTHAQALVNGELRRLKPLTLRHQMTMPVFVGYQLDEALKPLGITDAQLYDAIYEAFEDSKWRYSRGKRFLITKFAQHIDLVPGALIGDLPDYDDEEGDDIITLVLPGES